MKTFRLAKIACLTPKKLRLPIFPVRDIIVSLNLYMKTTGKELFFIIAILVQSESFLKSNNFLFNISKYYLAMDINCWRIILKSAKDTDFGEALKH